MALIDIQLIDDTGLIRVLDAAVDLSNTWDNSGKEFIAVLYSGDGELTITVNATISTVETQSYGTLAKNDVVYTLGTNDTLFIGPFPIGAFSDTDGTASFTFSTITGTKVGIFNFIY